jgi:hypothetical protein
VDNAGAYAGRAPSQLGEPIGAICGPCRVQAIAYEPKGVPGKPYLAAIGRDAHRKSHEPSPGIEPGLQAKFVWEVPTGGRLPTSDNRVHIYPCYAFETHIV